MILEIEREEDKSDNLLTQRIILKNLDRLEEVWTILSNKEKNKFEGSDRKCNIKIALKSIYGLKELMGYFSSYPVINYWINLYVLI